MPTVKVGLAELAAAVVKPEALPPITDEAEGPAVEDAAAAAEEEEEALDCMSHPRPSPRDSHMKHRLTSKSTPTEVLSTGRKLGMSAAL